MDVMGTIEKGFGKVNATVFRQVNRVTNWWDLPTPIALLNLCENGGHIVSSASLYGGTYNQLHYTFPKLGIEVSFIDDPDDLDAWKKAIRPNTRAFYGESIGNPKGDIFDFEGVAGIAPLTVCTTSLSSMTGYIGRNNATCKGFCKVSQ